MSLIVFFLTLNVHAHILPIHTIKNELQCNQSTYTWCIRLQSQLPKLVQTGSHTHLAQKTHHLNKTDLKSTSATFHINLTRSAYWGSDPLHPSPINQPFLYRYGDNKTLWSNHISSEDFKSASTETNHRTLTNDSSSLLYCVYALMGLGLYGSSSIRKISVHPACVNFHNIHWKTITPQIAYEIHISHIQPSHGPLGLLKDHYRLGIIISTWRKSQFSPAIIAGRDPPFNEHQSKFFCAIYRKRFDSSLK